MTNRGDPNWLWEFRAEDFVHARLDEEKAAAEALADDAERELALNRVHCLRLIAGEHSIYVDHDGRNHCRCITCEPTHGVPCTTMCRLARMWRHHPDYVAGWNRSIDDPRHRTHITESFVRTAELGGYRKEYEADEAEFEQRFTREPQPGGQFVWKCRACGAMGDPWSWGHARSSAAPQHPKCPPDPDGPWARTIRQGASA